MSKSACCAEQAGTRRAISICAKGHGKEQGTPTSEGMSEAGQVYDLRTATCEGRGFAIHIASEWFKRLVRGRKATDSAITKA